MKAKRIKNIGALIDVSRGAVIKFDFFKQIIDYLSLMGYTFVELYSEDIFDVKEEPFLGYLRGKYSLNELKIMDEYAKSKNIELIPAIQTLAHFTCLSTIEKINEDLFDIDDILLAENDRTYEFIENIIRTCRESFSTKKINIGMDEAWHLGQGRYLTSKGFKDKKEIFLKHLNKVSEICKKYDFECEMWSDMFFEMLKESKNTDKDIDKIAKLIPSDVTLCLWDYTHEDKSYFDKQFKLHKDLTKKVSFAGGTWCWKGFAPMNALALSTMEPAIKSCLDNGIDTVIATMWGDDGNETSKLTTIPSLFAISEFAKNNFSMSEIKDKFMHYFNVPFDTMLDLDLPNYIYQNNERRKDMFFPGKILFYQDPFLGKADYLLRKYDKVDYTKYATLLRKDARIAKNFSFLFEEEALLCDFLSHKVYLGIDAKKAYKENNKKLLKKVIKEFDSSVITLRKFKASFNNLWMLQNKPYCLEIHDARIGGLIERLLTCKNRLQDYMKNGTVIEELEKSEELEIWFDDKFWSNKYRDIFSIYNI